MFGFCCNAVRFILGPGKEVPWIDPFTAIRKAVTFLLQNDSPFLLELPSHPVHKKMTMMIHDNFGNRCFELADLRHKAP